MSVKSLWQRDPAAWCNEGEDGWRVEELKNPWQASSFVFYQIICRQNHVRQNTAALTYGLMHPGLLKVIAPELLEEFGCNGAVGCPMNHRQPLRPVARLGDD